VAPSMLQAQPPPNSKPNEYNWHDLAPMPAARVKHVSCVIGGNNDAAPIAGINAGEGAGALNGADMGGGACSCAPPRPNNDDAAPAKGEARPRRLRASARRAGQLLPLKPTEAAISSAETPGTDKRPAATTNANAQRSPAILIRKRDPATSALARVLPLALSAEPRPTLRP